jgi:DnaK suppressor protein
MATTTAVRKADLRQILLERRRAMQDEVQSRIRDGRADRANDVRDDLELSDADSQGDIELALLQMRADTLTRVDEALVRLDAGKYGSCAECDGEISERRLRALPFAVRCQACEQRREQEQGRARNLAQRRGGFSLFSDVVSS